MSEQFCDICQSEDGEHHVQCPRYWPVRSDKLERENADLREQLALYEGTLESRERNIADLVKVNKEAERKLSDARDAARREAAGICGDLEEFYWGQYKSDDPSSYTEGKSDGAQACAAAILARLGQPLEGQE